MKILFVSVLVTSIQNIEVIGIEQDKKHVQQLQTCAANQWKKSVFQHHMTSLYLILEHILHIFAHAHFIKNHCYKD